MPAISHQQADSGSPEACLDHCLQQMSDLSAGSHLLLVSYQLSQYWLPAAPTIGLTALYLLQSHAITLAVTDQPMSIEDELLAATPEHAFAVYCQRYQLPRFDTSLPLNLQSLNIAKPWGQEIWYTGVEERGVACFTDGQYQLPIPYLLSALPARLTANRWQQLILLKILDPLPDEVFGDLYFELHQEKREVYVVTHVDPKAWPAGEGAIRFGFNQQMRQRFVDDGAFRKAFAEAVNSYRQLRLEIDNLIDPMREAQGYALNEPVEAATMQQWMAAVPSSLQQQERDSRTLMNDFTETLSLQLGDVVKVPCLTPHALQHGVRTVEFQTPVYERMILSFAQKVLTQSEWDSQQAIDIMTIEPPLQDEHTLLEEGPGYRVERIVDFKDFEVRRIRLASAAAITLAAPAEYALLMTIGESLTIAGQHFAAEQAMLLPASWIGEKATNCGPNELSFLLALPK